MLPRLLSTVTSSLWIGVGCRPALVEAPHDDGVPPAASPSAPSEPTADPAKVESEDDPLPVWWTPPESISSAPRSEADWAAVHECMETHRVTAADVTAEELFDAANCVGTHHAIGSEIRIRTQLLDLYPTSEWASEALVALGRRYEQIDRRREAINAYRRTLGTYPVRDEARALGQRAVCLARSLGDVAGAEEILGALERLYGAEGFVRPPEVAYSQLCAGLAQAVDEGF